MLYNKSHKFYFITIFDICLHLFLSNGFCSLQYSLIFVRMWFSRQPSCALRVAVSDWSITNLPFMYYWSSVSEGKSGFSIMLSSVRCEIALFSLKLVSLSKCGHWFCPCSLYIVSWELSYIISGSLLLIFFECCNDFVCLQSDLKGRTVDWPRRRTERTGMILLPPRGTHCVGLCHRAMQCSPGHISR